MHVYSTDPKRPQRDLRATNGQDSTGVAAMKIPDKPPMMNIDTNDKANSMGVVNRMLPPQIVPSQLNVFTALGRAIIMVDTMNVIPRTGFMPETNI